MNDSHEPSVPASTVPRLTLRGITKRYPSVVANDGIDLDVAPGSLHAILGENGAGKSTLMKIIYGAVQPDEGELRWNGQPMRIASPADARALGIAMVFQHFSLFDTLTVAENVQLGLPPGRSLAQVSAQVAELGERYGLPIDPNAHVHDLSVGERQRVEIVRALLTDPQLLILDEPTSVLTPPAVRALFGTLRQLAAEGRSILYISHKLDEIQELCGCCTVLRGGRRVDEVDPRQETEASLARRMIGADPPRIERVAREAGEVVLSVESLNLPAPDGVGSGLKDVSLQLRAGEILGIAGVSGNGQQLLLDVLAGEQRQVPATALRLFGDPVGRMGPKARRLRGLRFVPEERLGRGAVPAMNLSQNMLLTHGSAGGVAHGWVRWRRLASTAREVITSFDVRGGGPQAAARSLSGGNLQKFIVGREMVGTPRVLIVAQPTWGVDVGASAQIRNALLGLRDEGCAVLVVSEELDELFEISDRLAVMAGGRLSPAVDIAQTDVETVGRWMSGLWRELPGGDQKEGGHAAA